MSREAERVLGEGWYAEQLRRPEWQKRRLQVLNYAGWRCQLCGAKDRTLHCHHSYYNGKKPWEYPKGAIISLCDKCHAEIHPPKEPVQPAQPVEVPKELKPLPGETLTQYFARFAKK